MKRNFFGNTGRNACSLAFVLLALGTQGCRDRDGSEGYAAPATPQAPQAMPADTMAADSPAADADAMHFYSEALQGGVAEAKLSEYARDHASAVEVRDLAATLVRDHQALNDKLRRASGIASDPPASAEQASEEMRLHSMEGTAFDAAWLEHMAQGHAKAIALYEAQARSTASGAAQALAADALPTLQSHRDAIERLQGNAVAGIGIAEGGNRMAMTSAF